ncbi:MAG TPA: translation initiation factor eIF-1A [Candidatus Nanoarchaeia archaeon]|nr:translation initiation factor eIF-1A [Candidatus Nanoarchaeia archaeon]
MNKKKEEVLRQEQEAMEIQRVKLPRGKQSIGVVEMRLGGGRMRVRCYDGHVRVCRIPGALKRRLWVRENDVVLVEPWEYGGEEKGDVIYKYRASQVQWLRRRGLIKEVTVDLEEF